MCYETHLQCGCKVCEDFKIFNCNSITPCPNLKNSTSNQTKCYWTFPRIPQLDTGVAVPLKRNIVVPFKGICNCCDLNQKCLSPKILDPDTCECQCPDGSEEDETTGNCTGHCKHFHGSQNCKKIFVRNPNQQCTLINNRTCECPRSCDEISDPVECNRTVCPGTDLSPPIMCK